MRKLRNVCRLPIRPGALLRERPEDRARATFLITKLERSPRRMRDLASRAVRHLLDCRGPRHSRTQFTPSRNIRKAQLRPMRGSFLEAPSEHERRGLLCSFEAKSVSSGRTDEDSSLNIGNSFGSPLKVFLRVFRG